MARKYHPEDLDKVQVHLLAKDALKYLPGLKTLTNAKDQLYGSRDEFEGEIASKKRSAYRVLAKQQGYKDVHDKLARKLPTHKD